MRIHNVREPFLCREGQFEEGKRSLCIGLDYQTVKKTDEFWCYLGGSRDTYYEIKREDALRIGQSWINPKGKTVLIVPLSSFREVKPKEGKKAREQYLKSMFRLSSEFKKICNRLEEKS